MRSTILRHAIWLALAAAATALAAAPPDKGGGGGEGETATNHLSYPAVNLEGPAVTNSFSATVDTLGVTYSYACDKPETIDTTTFPNTSCVTADGSKYLSDTECTATGAVCEGFPVERIYWQKVASNIWTAATVASTLPVKAGYVDWADNLESVTWKTTSVVRVETTPFAEGLDPMLTGYQMWHVFGKGTNEAWGVRTTLLKAPYTYQSPYAIIYTSKAKLNITKVSGADRSCDADGSGFTGTWNGGTLGWVGDGATKVSDIAYTPELNVGGKYVYGYNWNLRRENTAVDKAGWWRLTFYTTDDGVDFSTFLVDDPTRYAPPDLSLYPPSSTSVMPAFAAVAPAAEEGGGEEGGDEGGAYAPVVDPAANISYIDICLAEGTGSGGGGGGGGSGEGGPPEGGGGPPDGGGGGPPDGGGGGGPPEGRGGGGGPPAGVGGGGPPEGRGSGPPAGMGGSGDHEDGDHEP
jgi:hypothetical protein